MRDNNKHWEEEEDKRAWTLSVEEEEEQPEGPDTAQLLSHHSAAYLIRIQAATVLQLTYCGGRPAGPPLGHDGPRHGFDPAVHLLRAVRLQGHTADRV